MGKFFRVEIPAARGRLFGVGVKLLFLCAALLLVELRKDVDDLTAAIVATIRAGGVREHRLVAMRAERNTRARERVMGATLTRR
ncbi:MAG: hypothetical protein A3B37_04010 [Candidatus Sungbacteria bacterium RIFCSPLOWO2_01_FULL_59_16]|uniref:Uncharacterized protein n=1 Tax=Candidatus Sungbacteria bacterium RIFCSPLOWO2_01_FULL_59_16 TaxID=1802280 RepID=A0A1G2LCH0_9BACT|nr:MAG: hypothetical protein A3B37_04010 [Candidatus Sungbacteria bacterium RIFCSPLOWO2_01_FULL_59_16]